MAGRTRHLHGSTGPPDPDHELAAREVHAQVLPPRRAAGLDSRDRGRAPAPAARLRPAAPSLPPPQLDAPQPAPGARWVGAVVVGGWGGAAPVARPAGLGPRGPGAGGGAGWAAPGGPEPDRRTQPPGIPRVPEVTNRSLGVRAVWCRLYLW